ncbi:TPA: hypothetical protein LZ306_003367 [Enterobacter bugandensis]|uniref:hypothetical protein n=1 Tax=Enterobacter sp. 04-C-12-SI-ECC TaxID=3397243 RepID=UPI0039E1818D|nr:hypothetical protein [Enterobacter bugandensis]HBM7621112.1 hypothetical protein [Enterobacter bugandensis]
MRQKVQIEAIEKFVIDNPGTKSPEIIKHTSVPQRSVTSVLCHMVREKILRREGPRGSYRYYKYEKKNMVNSSGEPIVDHDLPNPLTAFINQRLREVRA